LVTGARDLAVPASAARDALARLPLARQATIQNAGHLAHEEQPDETLDAILPFLDSEGVRLAVPAGTV
ncbi:MAG: alpha/beta hydrolase, partial [Pseudomonadota bacterium]